jgi:hypothetical protein
MSVRYTLGDTSGSNILQMLGGKLKKGNVEIEFPAAGSKTMEEAVAWLEGNRSKIMGLIDTSASQRTQVKQIVQFTNDLVTAARASLKDEALQASLDLKLLPQAYIELKALYDNGLGNEALYKKIQVEASKFIDEALAQIKKLGCFVAGTLVHTKEGLKPIEEIKVGDYVLSKPESGEGELCYQPVTRTFEYDDRELYYVSLEIRRKPVEGEKPVWDRNYPVWFERDEKGYPVWDHDCIAVTGGHPIWVEQMEVWRSLEIEMEMEKAEIRDIHAWMTIE